MIYWTLFVLSVFSSLTSILSTVKYSYNENIGITIIFIYLFLYKQKISEALSKNQKRLKN